jgi:beta-RFAP synthase
MCKALLVDRPLRLEISRAIPSHAGLGSGTQLALAVGAAVREIAGLSRDLADDARRLDRGARSGVGLALFERGGLVVDAGRGRATVLPPIVAALPFPETWRVLLILDRRATGVHGEAEMRAFAALPPMSATQASEICRRTLMQILPGVAEVDLDAFGAGVQQIQAILGDHFASAQGGGRFTSPAVGQVATRLEAMGARGIGQSSLGPTAFAFAADSEEAEYLASRARADASDSVEIRVCRARSRGAEICLKEIA